MSFIIFSPVNFTKIYICEKLEQAQQSVIILPSSMKAIYLDTYIYSVYVLRYVEIEIFYYV